MKDLETAGVNVIQIDEPAFNVFFREVEERAHEGREQRFEREVAGAAECCERIETGLREGLRPAGDRAVKERLFPAAVVVDGAHRLARFGRDVADGGAVESPVGEYGFRGVEHALAGGERPFGGGSFSSRVKGLCLSHENILP